MAYFRESGRRADELPRWLRDMELTSEELTALATWVAFNSRVENADWLRESLDRPQLLPVQAEPRDDRKVRSQRPVLAQVAWGAN